jgi:RNA polymerase sigma factor (sigma-70 family)
MTPEDLFEQNKEWALIIMQKRAIRRGWPKSLAAEIDQAALIGLWDAAQKCSPYKYADFRDYAYNRVYGQVQDCLREHGWICPRSGRRPSMPETTNDVKKMTAKLDCSTEEYERTEFCASMVASVIDARIRKCMQLYYTDGLQMSMVASVLGISEARVSQLISKGLEQLKKKTTWFRVQTDALEPHIKMGAFVRPVVCSPSQLAIGDCVQLRLHGQTNAHLARLDMVSADGAFLIFRTPGRQERIYACEIAEVAKLKIVNQER